MESPWIFQYGGIDIKATLQIQNIFTFYLTSIADMKDITPIMFRNALKYIINKILTNKNLLCCVFNKTEISMTNEINRVRRLQETNWHSTFHHKYSRFVPTKLVRTRK